MLVRILKIMTNRAVPRCFTWSAILASIQTFSDWQYIFNGKNHRIFLNPYLHDKTASLKYINDHLVQQKHLFLYFYFIWSYIWWFRYFFIIFLAKRSECMWFIGYGAWTSLWRLKMVWTGGFQPWNSREPIMTASRNVVHSLERGSHTHSDHNTEKIMKN